MNKKFIVIFVILILIIVGLVTFSMISTIRDNNAKKNISISIEDFNNIASDSSNFKSSKVSEITMENIEEITGITSDNLEKVIGKKAVLNTDASIYILLEPKKEWYESVYGKITQFGAEYENEWKNYLEAEYDIVVDREIGKIANYIYLVISDDADDILKKVRNNIG